MDKPEFSVVIPAYNAEKYLNRSIQSVLNQTCGDYEIIVVDDGSTDGTLEVASGIQDARLRIIRQENLGVSAARNKGIEEARKAYIAFLDADDEWHPNFLSTMRNLIQRFPEAGLYGAGYQLVFPWGTKVDIGYEGFEEGGILTNYIHTQPGGNVLTTGSVVIPKPVLNELGGFLVGLTAGQDVELWARVGMRHPVAYVSKSLLYYHQTGQEGKMRFKKFPVDFERVRTIQRYMNTASLSEEEKKNLARTIRKLVFQRIEYMIQSGVNFKTIEEYLSLDYINIYPEINLVKQASPWSLHLLKACFFLNRAAKSRCFDVFRGNNIRKDKYGVVRKVSRTQTKP